MARIKSYSTEFINGILKQIQPPENKSVPEIAKETGISKNTIYTWVKKARRTGMLIPNSAPSHDAKWRKEDKLRIVFETFSLNEAELSQYCREHGLYISDIKSWRKTLESSFESTKSSKDLETELQSEKEKTYLLQKELRQKEKALAETAALLVLRKKANAIWGDLEDE